MVRFPRRQKVCAALLILALLVNLFVGCEGSRSLGDGLYRLVFFDVGQGDAAMILSPSGRAILIDCGPDDASLELSAELLRYGVREIDALILSHGHDDHVGGVGKLLRDHPIATIYQGNYTVEGIPGQRIEESECPTKIVNAGDRLELDGIRIDLLAPSEIRANGDNNDSLVLLVSIGNIRALFVGDLEFEGEQAFLNETDPLPDVDLLKVGHHGGATSTSEEFLDAVRPSVALISVGADNLFGHPSPKLLRRLEERGIRVFRTDLCGTIEFSTDGEKLLYASTEPA